MASSVTISVMSVTSANMKTFILTLPAYSLFFSNQDKINNANFTCCRLLNSSD